MAPGLCPFNDSGGMGGDRAVGTRAPTWPRPSADELLTELTARTRQQAGIVALGRAALAGVDSEQLFVQTVCLMLDVLPVEYAKVLQLLPDRTLFFRAGAGWKPGVVGSAVVEADYHSQAGYTLLSDSPVIVDDLATESRFGPNRLLREHGIVSGMSVVIRGDGAPYGILGVHSGQPRCFSVDDINCLEAAANVLADAIRRESAETVLREARDRERRLRQELERSAKELRRTQETERRRLARELHDEVGQTLTALKFMLERIEQHGPEVMPTICVEAKTMVADLLGRVHDLSLDLRPPVLDDFGLVPSLLWLTRRFEQLTNITIQFHHEGLARRLPDDIENCAYRLIQEALTNVARHAHADHCMVQCVVSGGYLTVTVRDHGKGFVVLPFTGGLRGMRERARELGGELEISSGPALGTYVCARLPLNQEGE